MKPILKSETTQNVMVAGGSGAALITLLQQLQTLFPEQDWLTNPVFLGASTWVINMVLLPWLSRLLAKIRGR